MQQKRVALLEDRYQPTQAMLQGHPEIMHGRQPDAVRMTTGSRCAREYSYHSTLVIFAGCLRESRKSSAKPNTKQHR